MKLLIRYIKKQGQNNIVEQTIVERNKLKIGRGTDQNILLPDRRVALGHAKFAVSSDDIKVSTASGKYVLFNEPNNELIHLLYDLSYFVYNPYGS